MNKKLFSLIRFFSVALVLVFFVGCKNWVSDPTKRLERKFVERKDHLESLYHLMTEISKETSIYAFVFNYQEGPTFYSGERVLIPYDQAFEDKKFRAHKEKLRLLKVLFQKKEFQSVWIDETGFVVIVDGGGVLGADIGYRKMLKGAKIEDLKLFRYRAMPGEGDWYSYFD